MQQHVSPSEFASKLGVSDDTVLRMLRRGDLPGLKVGQQWRIDPSSAMQSLQLSHGGGSAPQRTAASVKRLN